LTKCILASYRADKCDSCSKLCAHRIALHGLDGKSGRLGNANLPADYRGITLANSPVRESQPKIYDLLDMYVASFSRKHNDGEERIKSLYLWSESPGTGKTTTAAALISEWIACDYLGTLKRGEQPKQVSAAFIDVNSFQTEYNLATMTNDDEEIANIGTTIKRLQVAPFAVLDDVGTRSSTDAFTSYIHAIINARVAEGLPTVYTSNLPLEDMRSIFTERLYDRIRDQCGVIHFDGESKRGRR